MRFTIRVRRNLALLLYCATPFSLDVVAAPVDTSETLNVIAFGSCSQPQLEQPLWSKITADNPDLWIWLGDIIYADTQNDPGRFDRLYERQKKIPEYSNLIDLVPIIGTWDDHDYGANNAGREYPLKGVSQQALLDFLDEPELSLRRSQLGVYTSYLFGKVGKRLKVLLLDTRYHREAPGDDADILGERQWDWLENEFSKGDAELYLLVSSIQLLSDRKHQEKWGWYPAAKNRLFGLIEESKNPVIIMSGDVHFAEMASTELKSKSWPLVEITSSGMTHSISSRKNSKLNNSDSLYTGQNYGLMKIKWQANKAIVDFQIKDRGSNVRLERKVEYPITVRSNKKRFWYLPWKKK